MTDLGVFRACAKRVHSVYMILALVFAASGAQAGAWEEFERRCLVPMEDVEVIDLTAFEPFKRTDVPDGNAAHSIYLKTGHLIAEVSADGHPVVCVLNIAPGADTQTRTAAMAWLDRNAARYERWQGDVFPAGQAYISLFREPRVVIEFGFISQTHRAEFSSIIAVETDLES